MTTYIIRRLLLVIPILLGVATIVFALMFIVPGDPARMLMGQHGDERTLASLRHEMGLDRPVYVQYARFIGKLATGDLGVSYRQKRPVAEIIRDRFPATVKLAVTSMGIAIVIGIILILLLIGAFPSWGHSRSWGYGPSGGLGLIVIIVLVLVLTGRL